MTDFGHDGGVTSARLIGAVAGSAISLVYLLPKHRREAAVRFLTGLACGLIFGGPTGVWGAGQLGLEGRLSPAEIMLAGATLALEQLQDFQHTHGRFDGRDTHGNFTSVMLICSGQ